MQLSIPADELKAYLARQLDHFFPDGYRLEGADVDRAFELGLQRLEYCFSHISFPAYNDGKQTYFSYMHSDQYAQFLYFFSNSLWKDSQNRVLCDKLIGLNKALNGMFFSYKGKLPDIFFLAHPVGTILGNADYHNFMVVFQNVTVNTAEGPNGETAPSIGQGLFLGAGAKVIGNKRIGNGVSIGVDAVVYDQEIPDDMVVTRREDGSVRIEKRKKKTCTAQNYFTVDVMKSVNRGSNA